jgi:enterochelin esterase-like enzyme
MRHATVICKWRRTTGAIVLLLSLSSGANEIVDDSFKSDALGREYKFRVYLPDDYKDERKSQFPVIYLLHGGGADEKWWTGRGGAEPTLNALIARGQIRSAVAVMPGNGTNWYFDGPTEKAERAFMDELLPFIETKYRVSKERSARTIGGLSMGGAGALNFALKYPEKFCAAMLLSPAVYDPLPPATSQARKQAVFMKNGQFDPDIWKSHHYLSHIDAYQKKGINVSFWIMSGDHDSLGIALLSTQLYARFLPTQPKQVELRIVDGDHEAMVWRDALPDALRYADEQCIRNR